MQGKLVQQKLTQKVEANCDKFYIAMSNILPHNPYFKAKLFEYFDFDIKKTFEADSNDLKMFAEAYKEISIPKSFLKSRDGTHPEALLEEVNEKEVKFITYENSLYPNLLKNIEDFPLMFYYKGIFSDSDINFNRTLACIGSRRASTGAKESLSKIIRDMSGVDIVIVSGLAEGIDAVSHKCAVESGLKTIAVIGSGLKYTYPSSNKLLYRQIEDNAGLIISEYPYDMAPLPIQFPLRNRIVTGMSLGCVVAEARIKSGAMISARLTLEQGRELMCIPGLITNPNTEGIYYLIKNGASLVTSAEDIYEVLGLEYSTTKFCEENLSELEKQIIEAVSIEECTVEKLEEIINCDMSELMVHLTQMELKGLIKQINGSYYISG